MPHIIIDCTSGAAALADFDILMKNVAQAIADVGCFRVDDIKVRCREIPHSFLGTRVQPHAFVAAEVQVIDNKTDDQIALIGGNVMAVLEDAFPALAGKSSITVRIVPMQKQHYFRSVSHE